MNKIIKKNKGFTLIEVLVVMTILALFLGMIVTVAKKPDQIEIIDGHEYVVSYGYRSKAIAHNENCWCKKELK